MKTYRKKSHPPIEAMQVTDAVFDGPHPNPLHPANPKLFYNPKQREVDVAGFGPAKVGDYIIFERGGSVWVMSGDIFERTYEPLTSH